MKIGDLFEVTQAPWVAFENFCTTFYPLLQAVKSRNSTGDALNFISKSLDQLSTDIQQQQRKEQQQKKNSCNPFSATAHKGVAP